MAWDSHGIIECMTVKKTGCSEIAVRKLQHPTRGKRKWSANTGSVCGLTRRGQTREVLSDSEQWFQRLLETTRIIAWEADLSTWRFTYVGASAVEVLGYPLADWFKDGFWVNHIHPDDREAAIKDCAEKTRRNEHFELEYRMMRTDGRTVWFHDIVQVVRCAKGPGTIRGFLIDITDRKQAEEALRESEERLRLAMQASWTGTFEINLVSGEAHWNTVEFELLGLKPGDAPPGPETFFRYVHPDHVRRLRAQWNAAKRSGKFAAEFRIVRADGRERWLGGKGRFVIDDKARWDSPKTGRRPTRFLGVNFDITERKQAEAALRESEEQFRTLANAAPVLIWMSGKDKKCTWFNRPWLDFVGRPMEQQLGDGWAGNVHPDDLAHCLKTYCSAFDRRREFRMEYRLRRRDGVYRWLLNRGIPLSRPGGEFIGYIGSCIDITERRRLESELLEVTEREQRRIGHDLHDGLGQQLTALEMKCFLLLEDLAGNDLQARRAQLQAQAQQLSRALQECITTTRSLARGLAPVDLKADGLMGALKQLAHRAGVPGKVESRFVCQVPVTLDNSQTARHLYRIAQEAVNNALKHARPQRIDIALSRAQSMLRLKIKDDGCGFPGRRKKKSGMGLEIMRHRAHVIGASLEINSKPGRGVTVTCTLPFENHEH